MANIKISFVNQTSVLSDFYANNIMKALQVQIHRDFAPIWGIDADLTYVPKGQTPDPTHWWLLLLDNTDQAGALGYHDLTPAGLPMGKAFVLTDVQDHLKWSVTASHELLEMLADPDIDLTSFIQTTNTAGTLYAVEVCDAVEDDSFGYNIGGVQVSDFVLPAYFQPSIQTTKWDFQGHLTGPVPAMLSGGYLSQFVVDSGSGWTQITAQASPRSSRQLTGSRRQKRANKANLKVSTVKSF